MYSMLRSFSLPKRVFPAERKPWKDVQNTEQKHRDMLHVTVTQRSISWEVHVVGAGSGGWGAMDRLASAFLQSLWKCLCMARFCISSIGSSKYITAEVGRLCYKWPNWTPGHFARNFYHFYNKWNMGLKFSSIYFFSASLNHAFFFWCF